ncbi:WD40 repeat-like protein [Rhizopogon salebrosus TDB-379]|nr:WD40 repeat-like protein [Rhizopogon salebrosus TDB-379]
MSATASRVDVASPNLPENLRLPDSARNGKVCCVATFRDDERIVTASGDGSVIVWNLRTKEKERHWVHQDGATAVAVSPDDKKVVSGGHDCTLKLWDAESGHLLSGPWKQHANRVCSVAWSPDGSCIASCSADDRLIIWNTRTESSSGEPSFKDIPTGHDIVRAVAYCPKGGRVATCGKDFTIKIWDDAGVLLTTLTGHTEHVASVVWTNDGNRIISGSIDGIIRVWDPEQKTECTAPGHTGVTICCVAVSNYVYAAASANEIVLWNLKTHRRLDDSFKFSKRDEVNCVALTSNQTTLIVGTERSGTYPLDIGEIILGLEGQSDGPVVAPTVPKTCSLIRSVASVMSGLKSSNSA